MFKVLFGFVMVFLKHLNEISFILHYPCCKTFIFEAFCAKCLVYRESDCVDADTGDLFPYLLYVGHIGNDDVRCLRDLPVCHIDEEVAWRIYVDLNYLTNRSFELKDTRGRYHRFDVTGFEFYLRLTDALRCYIMSARCFAYLALRRPPIFAMSSLSVAVQQLRIFERRVREMDIVCSAISSRTEAGKKHRQQQQERMMGLCDKNVFDVCFLKWCIINIATLSLKELLDEEGERMLCVDHALS